MLFFLGVIAGSFSMVVIMSLMVAAKKGDTLCESFYHQEESF